MPAISTRLSDFKSKVKNLARPNRFMFSIPALPGGIEDGGLWEPDTSIYFTKTAPLPGRTIGDIPVTFFGQIHHEIGDPTFDTLDVTFWNGEDFKVKRFFESWQDFCGGVSNERPDSDEFGGILRIDQLSAKNEVIYTTYFHNAYPATIAAIELGHETNDTFEEFSVTFMYDYFSNDLAGEGKISG